MSAENGLGAKPKNRPREQTEEQVEGYGFTLRDLLKTSLQSPFRI